MKKSQHPPLREIPGGIEALADFFIPQAHTVILDSQTMVEAILSLQRLSEKLYREYGKLYQSTLETAEVPVLSRADHAGLDVLVGTSFGISSNIASGTRALSNETFQKDVSRISGIEKDFSFPVLRKWIGIRVRIFAISNHDRLLRSLSGFADPEITFQKEKRSYAKYISHRLGESLDSSNPFLETYPDILEEVEKAIWHGMLFLANITDDRGLIGDSFLPFNASIDGTVEKYLPGEQEIVHLVRKYRKKYFNQFLIHRAFTEKNERIFRH